MNLISLEKFAPLILSLKVFEYIKMRAHRITTFLKLFVNLVIILCLV